MSGGVIVVLFVLAFVLAISMSSKGERLRAFMLAAVVLLLSATPAMVVVHDLLLKMMVAFGA
jgi:hypothetical protein